MARLSPQEVPAQGANSYRAPLLDDQRVYPFKIPYLASQEVEFSYAVGVIRHR